MKILVTGARSQIGHELLVISRNYPSWTWRFFTKKEIDIRDENDVISVLADFKPDVIINTAAYTNVEKADADQEAAHKVNVTGPFFLSKYAKQALLIHISTDFVFRGDRNVPYDEDDKTDPLNFYGISKLEGENAVIENASRHIIIRTSWLYGRYQKNFLKNMLKLSKSRSELNVVDNQVGTPTYSGDLAEAIVKIIKNTDISSGIYHFSNEGVASWYDFAQAIFEYSEKPIKLTPVPASEFPSAVERPSYSVLNKGKVKKALNIDIPHWRESLKKVIGLLENGDQFFNNH